MGRGTEDGVIGRGWRKEGVVNGGGGEGWGEVEWEGSRKGTLSC